jgi:hypothetical protein
MRERMRPSFPRRSTVCSPPVKAALPSFVSVEKNEKVPWLPRRSGTHMPERRSPRNLTGGNVIGTRWMIEKMCRSPRIFQKAVPFWRSFIFGFSSGTT